MTTKRMTFKDSVKALVEWCDEYREDMREESRHYGDQDSEQRCAERIEAIEGDMTRATVAATLADKFRAVADELAGAVDSLLEQIEQMGGSLDDDDETIAEAMQSGVDALKSLRRLRKAEERLGSKQE